MAVARTQGSGGGGSTHTAAPSAVAGITGISVSRSSPVAKNFPQKITAKKDLTVSEHRKKGSSSVPTGNPIKRKNTRRPPAAPSLSGVRRVPGAQRRADGAASDDVERTGAVHVPVFSHEEEEVRQADNLQATPRLVKKEEQKAVKKEEKKELTSSAAPEDREEESKKAGRSAPPRWGEEDEGESTLPAAKRRGYVTREEKRRSDALLAALHIAFIPESPAVPELLPDPPKRRGAPAPRRQEMRGPQKKKDAERSFIMGKAALEERRRAAPLQKEPVPDGIVRTARAPLLQRASRIPPRPFQTAPIKAQWDELWMATAYEEKGMRSFFSSWRLVVSVAAVAIITAAFVALFMGRTSLVQGDRERSVPVEAAAGRVVEE